MKLETLLTPYSLIYLVAFIFVTISPHSRSRRRMMGYKSIGDGTASLYFALMGANSGACAALIPAIGSFIQAITPDNHLEKTKRRRLFGAIILAAISIVFVYKSPVDLLPIGSVIMCRFGELSKKAQTIRTVYWIGAFPWIAYHFEKGLYLPMIATTILSFSLLLSIIRHRHPSPKPTPAEAD